jgi:hypothetical protein
MNGLMAGATSAAEGCAQPCTAVALPALNGGGEGSCAEEAAKGNSTCWQTCPLKQGISGQATCSGNSFTSQSCKECANGELYSSLIQGTLVKYQETGTPGQQNQGYSVSISADGRVMVQGAYYDNVGIGSESIFLQQPAALARGMWLVLLVRSSDFCLSVFLARWFVCMPQILIG